MIIIAPDLQKMQIPHRLQKKKNNVIKLMIHA
jgi:hypothetical protein